jgi:hypothetical protein
VTASDPLVGWPPPPRPRWWQWRYATGTDWVVIVLALTSAALLLLSRTALPEVTDHQDKVNEFAGLGDAVRALVLFGLASAAGLTATVLYVIRLFSRPFPPWVWMLVASAASSAVWVLYALVPFLEA